MNAGGIAGLHSQLEQRWTAIEAEGPLDSAELRTVDLPVETGEGPLLAGAGADGPRLLIPLSAEEGKRFKEDRRSAGVHLVARSLTLSDGLKWFADLVCLRSPLRDVFTSLVTDAVVRIDANGDHPAQTVRRCLDAWRALLVGGRRLLSVKQLAGLFGEMHLLIELLGEDETALETWRGPFREPHDFARGADAVEVKASLADDGRVISVHGLRQLLPPTDGRLLLHHLHLRHELEGGTTVPDLVEAAGGLCDSGALMGRLHAAGYEPGDAEAYARVSFVVLNAVWYDVEDDFPRIVESSFGPGGLPPGSGA